MTRPYREEIGPYEDLVYVEGNEWCCLCNWWHIGYPSQRHTPLVCPECLESVLRQRGLSALVRRNARSRRQPPGAAQESA